MQLAVLVAKYLASIPYNNNNPPMAMQMKQSPPSYLVLPVQLVFCLVSVVILLRQQNVSMSYLHNYVRLLLEVVPEGKEVRT
jgi:hypothetical protein